VQWVGWQAVVALPEHIDVYNAGPIREELLSVINRGAKTLIADMNATISCDHAGADAVVRASQRAVISGAELRLVVTARIVSRVLSLSGLDRLVSIYPSLEAAMAASRAPAAWLSDENGIIPTAVTAEQEHRDREPFDTIITSLFHVGLRLQAAMDLPADAAREHIAAAVGYLDETIREVRDTAFTARRHETALSTPPDGGTE
jgi:anti-sigma B factor antagonist